MAYSQPREPRESHSLGTFDYKRPNYHEIIDTQCKCGLQWEQNLSDVFDWRSVRVSHNLSNAVTRIHQLIIATCHYSMSNAAYALVCLLLNPFLTGQVTSGTGSKQRDGVPMILSRSLHSAFGLLWLLLAQCQPRFLE